MEVGLTSSASGSDLSTSQRRLPAVREAGSPVPTDVRIPVSQTGRSGQAHRLPSAEPVKT